MFIPIRLYPAQPSESILTYRSRQNCSLLASLSFPEMATRVIFGSAASRVSFAFDAHPSEHIGGAQWGSAEVLLAAVESGVVKGVLWLFRSLIVSRQGNLCCLTATAREGRRPRRDSLRERDPGKRPSARRLLSRSTCSSALLCVSPTAVLVCPAVCTGALLGLAGKTGFFLLFLLPCSGSRCRRPRPCVCGIRAGIALRVP